MENILVLLSIIMAVNATILRLPCLEYGNFSIVTKNTALQGSVIATFNNIDVDACEDKCLLNPLCKTLNTKDDGTTCELNSQSIYDYGSEVAMVGRVGWTFRSTDYSDTLIGELCRIERPCGQGYICRDTCSCPGYECVMQFTDCKAQYLSGIRNNGIYPYHSNKEIYPVYCDLKTSNKWWIVFQRRIDGTVDFYRNWNSYKHGFGDMTRSFWLGLEKIHQLAPPSRKTTLRIDLKHIADTSKWFYAEYKDFSISNEADGYRLKVGQYSGNAKDSLGYHSNMKFTTYDRDNDAHNGNCGEICRGAWWYRNCILSNLNGMFPPPPFNYYTCQYMSWHQLHNYHGGIIHSEMKLTFE